MTFNAIYTVASLTCLISLMMMANTICNDVIMVSDKYKSIKDLQRGSRPLLVIVLVRVSTFLYLAFGTLSFSTIEVFNFVLGYVCISIMQDILLNSRMIAVLRKKYSMILFTLSMVVCSILFFLFQYLDDIQRLFVK